MKIRNLLVVNRKRIVLGFILGINLIASSPFIYMVTKSYIAPGMDGEMMLALIDKYRLNIYPKPFGYIPNINTGHAWPLFYGPVFTYVVAAISVTTGLDILATTKGLLLSCLIITPCLFFLISSACSKSNDLVSPTISAILFIFYTVISTTSSSFGPGMWGGLAFGMYGQYFGQTILYIWIILAIGESRNPIVRLIKIASFSFVLLSGFFQLKAAYLVLGALILNFLISRRFKAAIELIIESVFATLALSFWLIPSLADYRYISDTTSTTLNYAVMENYLTKLYKISHGTFVMLLIAGTSLFVGIRESKSKTDNRNRMLNLIFTLLPVALAIGCYINVPFIPDARTVNSIFPLIFVPAGYLLQQLWKSYGKAGLSLLVINVFCLLLIPLWVLYPEIRGFNRWVVLEERSFKPQVQYLASYFSTGDRWYFLPFLQPNNYLLHQRYLGYLSRNYNVNTLWIMFSGANATQMDTAFFTAEKMVDYEKLGNYLLYLGVNKIVTDTPVFSSFDSMRLLDNRFGLYIYENLEPQPILSIQNCNGCAYINPTINIVNNIITVSNLGEIGIQKELLLRYSYFSYLKDSEGGTLTPTPDNFIIVRTKSNKVAIYYAEGKEFIVGKAMSLMVVGITVLYLFTPSVIKKNSGY